jgi:ABC-2 type transport system permease protein
VKLREILRFEFVYQARRVRTWLYFVLLLVVAYLLTKSGIDGARDGSSLANSPSDIAITTVICNALWMLTATAVAGSAAARDVQTRMDPLVYTTPISKADYLGGRFLAAFMLNASILLMVPAGIVLALLVPGAEPGILGPFRPAAYLSAYLVLALPTAFVVTAIQFSLAVRSRRAAVSYVGSALLLVTASIVSGALINLLQMPTLGKLLDPVGFISVVGVVSKAWTPIEKNTLLIGMQGSMLANRVLWIGIGLGVLALTCLRFRFGHHAAKAGWWTRLRARRAGRRRQSQETRTPVPLVRHSAVREGGFGFATHARQTFAIAWMSFWTIAKSPAGRVLCAVPILVALAMPALVHFMGVPFLPKTAQVLTFLTAPVADNPRVPWVLIPLLTVYYTGELVWRERDAGLSQMVDTTPVPEWGFFLGKLLGFGLVLAMWMALLAAAGVLGQARMGYFGFEIGLYLRILFGIQLIDYLLFAVLVLTVHAVVNQKQVGYLVAVIAYGVIAVASRLGIEHRLLVYGSAPGWTYSDMRGFGASLGPWAWFKLYWAAWALLLAVTARLLWARGTERGPGSRLRLARQRFAGATAGMAAAGVTLLISVGGFVFYNTNVLHAYVTTADRTERGAEYERRYGRYAGIPQPRLTTAALRVEIYPERREADVRGTYGLVNDRDIAIESIHLATARQVDTRAVSFDRPIARVAEDADLSYRIYTLAQPLQPGETVQLTFEVHGAPHGFRNDGVDASIVANGTHFTNLDWLPAIGYQRNRELGAPGVRRRYGLAPRPASLSLDDGEARRIRVGGDPVTVDTIVGTSADQTALAPGTLRRTWTEGGRRYFQYVTDVPVNNQYGVFSARYAQQEEQWTPSTGPGQAVAIQIFHHPAHTVTLGRMVASVRASLDHYTRDYGPYPYSYLRLIESPALMGVRTDAATVEYGEGFALLNPGDGPQDVDVVFAVVAHGVARGWWGMQVVPADVAGAGLLGVTLETYSAMRVLEDTRGPEQLRRYLGLMRFADETARPRAAPPLLRAIGPLAFSRQGPFALYALREYIGKEQVDEALRRLLEKYRSGAPPLPTSRDLYRELQAVTPESLQYLLHDLFEKNTFWEIEAQRAAARQTADGAWQVTLDVQARKVVVDEAGVSTDVPMDDWIEIGIYGDGAPYLQRHRVRSGKQTITVTVPHKPSRAGIDPRHLLSDYGDTDPNIKAVKIGN